MFEAMMNEPDIPSMPKENANQREAKDINKTILEHFATFNFDEEPKFPRLCKIVCTIGPATKDVDKLVELMKAGMNYARLNFSHGKYEFHGEIFNNVNEAAKKVAEIAGLESYPVGIALDTKGPEIRTGLIEGDPKGEIELKKGSTIKITTDDKYFDKCNEEQIYLDYKNITKVVKKGDQILVDDGLIYLEVKEVNTDSLKCEVLVDSTLSSQKGCNLPGVVVDLPALSEKDKEDLKFGVELGVDCIFASFIRNAENVHEIREELGEEGKHIEIISKIETLDGVHNMDEIIEASDGIMVARGDLGLNIPTCQIFKAQKMMIAKCLIAGKPVITATQMLDSMIKKPRPTRAEACDVANAVLDGTDCVMLSGESAKGSYPVECVQTMSSICNEAESTINSEKVFGELLLKSLVPANVEHSTAIAAVCASFRSDAAAILVLTTTGYSAFEVAKYRPRCPIIAITREEATTRKCQLRKGTFALYFAADKFPQYDEWVQEVESRFQYGIAIGKKWNMLKEGDTIILLNGWRKRPGSTNTIRIINI